MNRLEFDKSIELGPVNRRPNFCAGVTAFKSDGKMYKLVCSNAAKPEEAQCSGCKARERDELIRRNDAILSRRESMTGKKWAGGY